MKTILAIMGSARKKGSGYKFVHSIEEQLMKPGDVRFKYLYLSDYEIKHCKGCMVCYERGETTCPLKDDVLHIQDEMSAADGVIFYTPTYVMNVSGMMKTLIDRFSFACHRPLYAGKKALMVTTVAGPGTFFSLQSLSFPVTSWGFRVMGRLGVRMDKHDLSKGYRKHTQKILTKITRRFYASLTEPVFRPTFFELVTFHMRRYFFVTRSSGHIPAKYDRQMWITNGWADKKNHYFCEARINPFVNSAALLTAALLRRIVSA